MKINIHTKHNKGFKWACNEKVHFKGYLLLNDTYYTETDALELFTQATFAEAKQLIQTAEGMFAVIINDGNSLLAAMDCIRTFPLFYSQTDAEFTLSDDPYIFSDNHLNVSNTEEFLLTGFTTGPKTMLDSVFQLQAAEIMELAGDSLTFERYYSHQTGFTSKKSKAELANELRLLLDEIFATFVKTLEGKQVAISLSGGYDSRLIATMLKRFGHKDVVCFTYGRIANEELSNSKKTADILGFPWHFVEYNEASAQSFLDSETFKNYVHFSGRLSSMPYLQDYFAVEHLIEQKLVANDCIFISGHSGDMLAGSHLKGRFKKGDHQQKAIDTVFESNYNLNDTNNKEGYLAAIKDSVISPSMLAYSVLEDWDWKERQAKFIVNSASVYDFFGYEYRIPLWNKSLMAFFKDVPLALKDHKALYDEVLITLFDKYNLNFPEELQDSKRQTLYQRFKDSVKKQLPDQVLKKVSNTRPWHAYDLLTAPMLAEIADDEVSIKGNNYNAIICYWYLKHVKSKFSN